MSDKSQKTASNDGFANDRESLTSLLRNIVRSPLGTSPRRDAKVRQAWLEAVGDAAPLPRAGKPDPNT